ncbi:MAG: GIY-YIG nuclease family protein [Acidobacteria bacterium]|nr:GIY-YIG nuclease family protein [Acidobacteriota bacterium]
MADAGCYQLLIEIKKDIAVSVGALGVCRFERGFYVYTGSAMKNLEKRVARHRRKEKKLRWHIDYLLAHPAVEVKDVAVHLSEDKEECLYNQKLIAAGATAPVRGFGSSDCRACEAHLLRFRISDCGLWISDFGLVFSM